MSRILASQDFELKTAFGDVFCLTARVDKDGKKHIILHKDPEHDQYITKEVRGVLKKAKRKFVQFYNKYVLSNHLRAVFRQIFTWFKETVSGQELFARRKRRWRSERKVSYRQMYL